MKDTILNAAVRVLVRNGLNNWTVAEVAKEAGCAKGLINYHYRSKQALLQQAAATLRDDRWTRRQAAVATEGTGALDRLWAALLEEVQTGRFAAWLSLLAAPALRQAAASLPGQSLAMITTLLGSLGLDERLEDHAGMIAAVLDGLELRLLQGAPPREAEEAYHRFWLTVLEM